MQILVASGNKNKVLELRTIAQDFDVELCCPKEFAEQNNLGSLPEVDEDRPSFLGNAQKKAEEYFSWANIPVIADDSGLEVDILDGRPGIHSARYGGEGLTDRLRCEHLLFELNKLHAFDGGQRPVARFHCCLVYMDAELGKVSASTTLEGEVLDHFSGDAGFGYDPLIFIPTLNSTLASLSFAQVCIKGFRAQAFRVLAEKLPEVFIPK